MMNSKLASLSERFKAIDLLVHSNPEALKPSKELVPLPGNNSTQVGELSSVTSLPAELSSLPSQSASPSLPEVVNDELQQSVEREKVLASK